MKKKYEIIQLFTMDYFFRACESGEVATVASLLLSVDPSVDNNHAIKSASLFGQLEVVRLLLEDPRVDPNECHLNSPLELACDHGHIEIVRLLLTDSRVDPSVGNNFPIQTASHFGYVEIVRLLLEDSRVNPDADNKMALRWANNAGHTKVVQLLTEHQFRLDGPEYNKNIL